MLTKFRFSVTPATVLATVALVFSLTGGAYAAGHFLITSTKQISPKVLKQLKGASGAKGAPGANGTNGSAGAAGEKGPAGTNGTNGTNGTSVASKEVKVGESSCKKLGGSEFTAGATTTFACNGSTGFTETLPSGKTETGEWEIAGDAAGAFGHAASAVSFNIPLAAAPAAHYLRTTGKEPFFNAVAGKEEEREQSACPGSAAAPEAKPGNLCVYAASEANTATNPAGSFILPNICALSRPTNAGGGPSCIKEAPAADADGFGLLTVSTEEGFIDVAGTWAATAE